MWRETTYIKDSSKFRTPVMQDSTLTGLDKYFTNPRWG